jgi:hypothetical protein
MGAEHIGDEVTAAVGRARLAALEAIERGRRDFTNPTSEVWRLCVAAGMEAVSRISDTRRDLMQERVALVLDTLAPVLEAAVGSLVRRADEATHRAGRLYAENLVLQRRVRVLQAALDEVVEASTVEACHDAASRGVRAAYE